MHAHLRHSSNAFSATRCCVVDPRNELAATAPPSIERHIQVAHWQHSVVVVVVEQQQDAEERVAKECWSIVQS